MNLALFDFDGTVTTQDSYLFFTKYLGWRRYLWGCFLLSPRIAGYLAHIYPNHLLKEDFLRFFYRDRTLEDLQLLAARFCREEVPNIIRPAATHRIRWHQDRGDTVVVVSACPRIILEPWCRAMHTEIIATELATEEQGRITGKIAGKNCWGPEKVRQIELRYALNKYSEIFAYGDSAGDIPMLEIAAQDKRFYKPFR
jgi:phosphatidylglycerophosphatase C